MKIRIIGRSEDAHRAAHRIVPTFDVIDSHVLPCRGASRNMRIRAEVWLPNGPDANTAKHVAGAAPLTPATNA